MEISLLQSLTLGIAFLGAVLGVLNTWHVISSTKVKLKVIPKHAIPFGGVDHSLTFCIEVINLGSIPITIYEAGVMFNGTSNRGAILDPIFSDGGKWPKRLEPRSSFTVYSQLPSFEGKKIKCAYAKTECGVTKKGNSAALKQLSK